jgi:hypothetical protein
MVLTLTFYRKELDSQGKKQFLHELVKEHPLWKIVDFWQGALIEAIKEEAQKRQVQHDDPEDQLNRDHQLIFGQLTTYGFDMMLYGHPEYVTIDIILRVCNLVHLPDKMVKDICHAIEDHYRPKPLVRATSTPTSSPPKEPETEKPAEQPAIKETPKEKEKEADKGKDEEGGLFSSLRQGWMRLLEPEVALPGVPSQIAKSMSEPARPNDI